MSVQKYVVSATILESWPGKDTKSITHVIFLWSDLGHEERTKRRIRLRVCMVWVTILFFLRQLLHCGILPITERGWQHLDCRYIFLALRAFQTVVQAPVLPASISAFCRLPVLVP